MKSTPAYILRNCMLWFEGDVKEGQASEMTIPPFKIKTEKIRNAGMVSEREIPMGFERENAKFKMLAVDPHVISRINAMPGTDQTLMITGALVDEDGVSTNATCYCRGYLKGMDLGSWKAGDKSEGDYEFVHEYIKITIGGKTLIEADDYDVTVGGVSQTNDIRAALLV